MFRDMHFNLKIYFLDDCNHVLSPFYYSEVWWPPLLKVVHQSPQLLTCFLFLVFVYSLEFLFFFSLEFPIFFVRK